MKLLAKLWRNFSGDLWNFSGDLWNFSGDLWNSGGSLAEVFENGRGMLLQRE